MWVCLTNAWDRTRGGPATSFLSKKRNLTIGTRWKSPNCSGKNAAPEAARRLGMQTIEMDDIAQLKEDWRKLQL
jgi:hypothetical protein